MFDVAPNEEWMAHPERNCDTGSYSSAHELRRNAKVVQRKADQWYANGTNAAGAPAYAKKLCAGCPVAIQCLDHAMKNREEGIWGGTTETMRETIRRNARNKKAGDAA